MKKKKLSQAILFTMITAMSIGGGISVVEATEYTSTITNHITLNNGDCVNVTTQNSGASIDPTQKNSAAIDTTKNNISIIANSEIPITVTASKDYTAGIKINGNHKLETSGSGKLKLNILANQVGYGIWINSGYNPSDPDAITTHFSTDLDINMQKNPNSTSKLSHLAAIKNDVYDETKHIFDGNVAININADNASLLAGIENSYGTITFNKSTAINISGQSSEGYGIATDTNSNIKFTDKATINVVGQDFAVGIWSADKSEVQFSNDTTIKAIGADDKNSFAIFNYYYNSNDPSFENNSRINISKNNNSIDEADSVNINITGNIYTGNHSQTIINAASNSLINGWIYNNTDEDNDADSSTTLALHNGATWQNTGESNLTNLVMNNGILTQSSTEAISIANYSGTGKALFTANDDATNGVAVVSGGNIKITNASQGSVLNADLANNNKINSLDKTQAEASLNAIANKLIYTANDGNLTGTVHLQEGLITPAISATLNFDESKQGYVTNIQIAEDNTNTGGNNGENNNNNGNNGGSTSTTTMDAMRNIGAASIISWRQEDSTLGQRLGVLRESKDNGGIWVRMNRGKYEYQNALHGQYNFFQMGYDKAFGNWHYGAAISHNDGKTTYTNGKGNNDSTSLSLYGTWLGNAGHYADIVLKEGRLSTDYDIYAPAGYTHGKYNNWGTSISGEYGRKIDFQDFYLTPQAQLTFMRIGGKNYTTANDIQIDQDSLYSTVGRIGVEIGKNITDKGNAYLRTSLLHEFAGDADTRLMLNGISNSYTQDIGNTWYELGIGFNYQTAANSYLYADVAKTFGDDYKTQWQWNVGMRWNF